MSEEGIGSKGLKTKLIINYLPQSMTDQEFHALFSAIGPVENTSVMRDRKTDYSFGYGFVDYSNPADAVTAISKLNGYKILNKTLRVAYSKPPGSSKNVNLYLTGLTPSIDEKALENLFGPYGELVYTRILRNQDGTSKSVGFVLFKDKEKADIAMKELQDYDDGTGMKLQIKYAKDSADQKDPHPKYQEFMQQKFMQQSMGMGGMGMGMGGSAMGGFQRFPSGPMYQDPYGGGFGVNPMNNNFGGQKAMRGRDVSSRYNPISRPQLGAGPGMGMGMGMGGNGMDDPNATNLFCYFGMDPTDADVYSLFSKFGRISKVDIVRGKGYAFVHMPVAEEANEAVMSLNGLPWQDGKTLQVSVRKAK